MNRPGISYYINVSTKVIVWHNSFVRASFLKLYNSREGGTRSQERAYTGKFYYFTLQRALFMSKKRKYVVYRDESDSDDYTTIAYARMVAVSTGGRRQVIVPCSPTKLRAGNLPEDRALPLQTDTWEADPWEPTLGDDLAFDEVESRPVTVGKVPAKRYAHSVRFQ